MGVVRVLDAPPLVDLGDCRDIVVTRIVRIERLPGGMLRFIFGVDEEDEHGNRRTTVVDRQVWPMCLVSVAIRQAQRAIDDKPSAPENGDLISLMH